jgi:hypothetical protein
MSPAGLDVQIGLLLSGDTAATLIPPPTMSGVGKVTVTVVPGHAAGGSKASGNDGPAKTGETHTNMTKTMSNASEIVL